MPTATAARRRTAPAKDEVAELERLARQPEPSPAANAPVALYDPFNELENPRFFQAVNMIADKEWEQYMLYLYRLEPRVRNPEGEKKFISKYQRGIDEEVIQQDHGGGKFMLTLAGVRKGDTRERSHIFSIDGRPNILPGQTVLPSADGVVLPSTAPAPPPNDRSDLSAIRDVVRELARNPSQDAGSAAGIDMMRQATTAALEVVRDAAKRENSSTTGNPLIDKMIDAMITKMVAGDDDKHFMKVADRLERAIEKLATNQTAPSAPDPLAQLSVVKELTGVDSILDLMRPAGDDAWKTKLVETGATLVGVLPQLLQAFAMNQEQQFRRSVYLEQLRHGTQPAATLPPSMPGSPPAQPPSAPAGSHPQTAHPPGEATMPIFDPTAMLLEDIVTFFDEGLDGFMSARLIMRKYPQIVTASGQLLSDTKQVQSFAQQTPPLSEIATEEGFPEFLNQFCRQIQEPQHELQIEDEKPEPSKPA